MSRHAVLVVDPETSRRKELAHGLSEFGYEVEELPLLGPLSEPA